MSSQHTSSKIAGRLAVFSTLAASCALLVEYILLSQGYVGYFGFVGFLMIAAIALWSGFYGFAKKYQSEWYDQVIQKNKDLQLQALFSTLNPWPVLRFDRYGQLISKNSCAKTFFYTLKHDGQHQRSVFDFFPEITKETWLEIVNQETHFELEHNRSGYWLCFYFRSHIQLGVINVYGFDVTRYKRNQLDAEKKMKQTVQETKNKTQLLLDTFEALRWPAKAVRSQMSDEYSIDYKAMQTDLLAITDIVSRLEDLTELDVVQFRQYPHSFDCRFMFETLVQNAAQQAYRSGSEVVFDCDLGWRDFIIADGRRLQQAIAALLRFAIERSAGHLILVKVRWISSVGLTAGEALDNSIGYESAAQNMVLRVSIHDSGHFDERIIQLFSGDGVLVENNSKFGNDGRFWNDSRSENNSRSENDSRSGYENTSTESEVTGYDLNLRFVSILVPLVGGEVAVQGSPLGGHAICLDWPVRVSPDHDIVDQSHILEQYHIHVFDYVRLSAESIAKTLSRAGASVALSATPSELFVCIEDHRPHVVVFAEQQGQLLDCELLEKVRACCDGQVAICAVVYCEDDFDHPQFDDLDIQAIITKPISSHLLIQAIQKAVSVVEFDVVESGLIEGDIAEHDMTSDDVTCKKPKILVIDDDLIVLHLMSDLLKEMGVDVAIAESGVHGLALLSRDVFDLVIVDIQMPDMSGFEVTQNIRTSYSTQMPILGLTASEAVSDRQKALCVGMNDYLMKPVDRELLAQRLSVWVYLPDLDVLTKESYELTSIDGETPMIHVRDAIRLLSEDQEMFIRSLLRFYGRFIQEGQILMALVDQQNIEIIIQRLHGMRGAASNIGAYYLRDAIFSLESQLRQNGITDQVRDQVHDIAQLLDRVMVEAGFLLHYFLAQGGNEAAKDNVDVALLHTDGCFSGQSCTK